MSRKPQPSTRAGGVTDRQMRDHEVRLEMGVHYDTLARTAPWRRRLLGFLYHPLTELVIFFLILTSLGLLVADLSPVGDRWNSSRTDSSLITEVKDLTIKLCLNEG